VLQSSANLSGGRDPRRLHEVPAVVRAGADLVLDGGELPGVPSTVLDLRGYEEAGRWDVLREGALAPETIAARLEGGRARPASRTRDDLRGGRAAR
nr:hypothetical protein [Actinomycetota bacterium]